MYTKANSPASYLAELPAERVWAFTELRNTIVQNLPEGFVETMSYGMITYVVPHSLYPAGYHCDPKQALPFLSIASQKNFIAVYHMGMYADKTLLDWFTAAYTSTGIGKPDMGKSCIRFKKPELLPFSLIGELASKITPGQWIQTYEAVFKARKS